MPEVQKHGFAFETWVLDQFFGGHRGKRRDEWDAPKSANIGGKVPAELSGLPVSIKVRSYGDGLNLGDALRQFSVAEDFLLIAGFWVQAGEQKMFVAAEGVRVKAADWHNLFGIITEEEMKKLDATIKDRKTHYTDVRIKAQEMKSQPPFSLSQMVLNPKIDSGNQRRLQCTLPFAKFWELAGKPATQVPNAKLFGVEIPTVKSPPRIFGK